MSTYNIAYEVCMTKKLGKNKNTTPRVKVFSLHSVRISCLTGVAKGKAKSSSTRSKLTIESQVNSIRG